MINELIEVSNNLEPELTPIPADNNDVCSMCRAWKPESAALCASCRATSTQVGHPCRRIIPISYYRTPSPLRDRMHNYKDSTDPEIKRDDQRAVAAILARYLHENGSALVTTFGPWDHLVVVPPTKRNGPAPLQTAIETHFPGEHTFCQPLKVGPSLMDFNQASETGFVATSDLTGRSFLLLDDTFTTGARIQSAHHALKSSGANVKAALVITRKINPSDENQNLELWCRQAAQAFTFGTPPWWTN